MAQGSKYTDEQREQALAMLTTMSIKVVSQNLNIPENTLRDWKNNAEKINTEFVKLRNEKKKQFVESAWGLIEDSMAVAKTRMSRARRLEDNIDVLVSAIKKNSNEITQETGLSWFTLLDIIKELNTLKNPKLSEISTLIGTIYDKQALINKEATVGLGTDASLEEVLRGLQGEEM